MDKKPPDFGDDYKTLPLEMRVRVNMMANSLLEIQKENNAFRDDWTDRFVEGESREDRGEL